MSALGHEQTSSHVLIMSVLPLKADIHKRGLHVRFVSEANSGRGARSLPGGSEEARLERIVGRRFQPRRCPGLHGSRHFAARSDDGSASALAGVRL